MTEKIEIERPELTTADVIESEADWCGTQASCKDCKEWVDPQAGCYAVKGLPENWREVEPYASQACATEGCTCWGGPDRECEDCWLSLK